MALGTSALRSAWSPACRTGNHLLPMYVGIDAAFKKWRYKPGVGTGAANCRPITGGSGYSLHSYFGDAPFTFWNGYRIPMMALAVDVNPGANPYGPRLVTDMPRGMVDDITRIRTKNGKQLIGWGGYFTPNHDAMHYQGVCTPADMATGIDPATLPLLPSTLPSTGDDLMLRIATVKGEPTASGDQKDVAEKYRVLSTKDKGGKSFDVEAWHLTGVEYDTWKFAGLDETTSVIPASLWKTLGIPVHGGSFAQTGR